MKGMYAGERKQRINDGFLHYLFFYEGLTNQMYVTWGQWGWTVVGHYSAALWNTWAGEWA